MTSMKWGTGGGFPAVYEELNVPAFFTAFADAMLERARPADGERLLDVATGTGVVLRRARARTPGLARLVGLDLTAAMLVVAREKTDGIDAELLEGDAAELPFEDGTFDIVTCQQGLQFFPGRKHALQEFHRVLAPGGRAVVSCWCAVDTAPGHEALVEAVREHVPDQEPMALAPFMLDDGEELGLLLTAGGFEDIEVERVDRLAHFASPEDLARSFLVGSPMALGLANVPAPVREALARDVAARVRERFGEPVEAPMATNVAVGYRTA